MEWEEFRKASKELKKSRQNKASELIFKLSCELEFEVITIAPHHLRLFLAVDTVDIFPQSKRATIVGSGKWFRIENIEQYIKKAFI